MHYFSIFMRKKEIKYFLTFIITAPLGMGAMMIKECGRCRDHKLQKKLGGIFGVMQNCVQCDNVAGCNGPTTAAPFLDPLMVVLMVGMVLAMLLALAAICCCMVVDTCWRMIKRMCR